MPGFAVPGMGGGGLDDGGMVLPSTGAKGKVSSGDDYYYVYMWEIWQLFGEFYDDANNRALVHLRDMTTPTFTVNQDRYVASSLEYKWAKSVTWEDVKVTWYDTVGLLAILKKWRKSVWRPDLGLQVASEYKKYSRLDIFLPTGQSVQSWCLTGSWPKVIRHGEMTYTNSDVKIAEVTIAYDWAEEKTADEDVGAPCGAD